MTTNEAFEAARGLACLIDPDLGDIRISGCDDVERDHEDSPRVFCHVFHVPGFICVADDFMYLPDEYQLGVMLHEFGHLATGSGEENHADAWVREVVGIPLEYRDTLEWVSLDNVEEAYRRLLS